MYIQEECANAILHNMPQLSEFLAAPRRRRSRQGTFPRTMFDCKIGLPAGRHALQPQIHFASTTPLPQIT